MQDKLHEKDEIIEVLMAISVVAKRLARNLAILEKGENLNERHDNCHSRPQKMYQCDCENSRMDGRNIHRY